MRAPVASVGPRGLSGSPRCSPHVRPVITGAPVGLVTHTSVPHGRSRLRTYRAAVADADGTEIGPSRRVPERGVRREQTGTEAQFHHAGWATGAATCWTSSAPW